MCIVSKIKSCSVQCDRINKLGCKVSKTLIVEGCKVYLSLKKYLIDTMRYIHSKGHENYYIVKINTIMKKKLHFIHSNYNLIPQTTNKLTLYIVL